MHTKQFKLLEVRALAYANASYNGSERSALEMPVAAPAPILRSLEEARITVRMLQGCSHDGLRGAAYRFATDSKVIAAL